MILQKPNGQVDTKQKLLRIGLVLDNSMVRILFVFDAPDKTIKKNILLQFIFRKLSIKMSIVYTICIETSQNRKHNMFVVVSVPVAFVCYFF